MSNPYEVRDAGALHFDASYGGSSKSPGRLQNPNTNNSSPMPVADDDWSANNRPSGNDEPYPTATAVSPGGRNNTQFAATGASSPSTAGAGRPDGVVQGAAVFHGMELPEGSKPLYNDPAHPELDSRFVVSKYQDLWAAIAFYIHIFIMFVVACVNFSRGLANVATPDTTKNQNQAAVQHQLDDLVHGTATALAFLIPMIVGMLFLMKKYPEKFIQFSCAAIMLLLGISTIAMMVTGLIGPGIMQLIFFLLFGFWLYLVRYRIPLAACFLEWSINTCMTYWGGWIVSFGSFVACGVLFIFWCGFALPTMHDLQVGHNNGAQVALFLFQLLVLFWMFQVGINVVHCTVAGTVATFYFVGMKPENTPEAPTLAALKRAMTTSFGSICFASLVVAIIQLIKFLVQQAYENNKQSVIACIFVCILDCIESLMRYFNQYALVFVSIYGCDYISAATATWDLVKQSAWGMLANDNLVGTVFTIVTLFSSFVVASLCAAIFHGPSAGAVWFSAFCLSLFGFLVVFRCIESGVVCFFVCVADAPEVLQRADPELKRKIEAAIEEAKKNSCPPCCPCGPDDGENEGQQQAPRTPQGRAREAGDV